MLVLADDLTSATEVAGRMGSPEHGATVLLEPMHGPSLRDVNRGCVVTGTRALQASQAAAMIEQCVRRHIDTDRPLPIVVKTMDSSLRGQWAAELASAMRTLSIPLAVVAPAFPPYARITRGGRQYAEGLPVHLGPAGRDPRTPVTSSHIATHLHDVQLHVVEVARPSSDGGLRLSRLIHAAYDRPTALVVDAEDAKDLELVARYVGVHQDVVWCAGPGLALEIAGGSDGTHPRTPPPSPKALAVVGSLHPTTRAQVEHARVAGIPVVSLTDDPNGTEIARSVVQAFRTARLAIVCSPPAHLDEPDGLIASVVAYVLEQLPDTGLVLSGGDTALATCARLAARSIEILGEWDAGIPFGRLDNDLATVVVTKAGGFGGQDALTSLLNEMKTADTTSATPHEWSVT